MSKFFLTALAASSIVIAGCATRGEKEAPTASLPAPAAEIPPAPSTAARPEPKPTTTPAPESPAELTDEARAAALWEKIAAYKSWPSPDGDSAIRPGDSIHGDHVRFFGNSTANANVVTLPAGSILVKEGYRDAEGSLLKAITAMEKLPGYNDEAGDWFFARYNDSGTATRINRGCASCHEDAGGDDFSFIND